MEFRTEIIIPQSNIDINYQSKVLFIGSCFSNNIGEKLQGLKFNTGINPFGVLYNPLSVSENINLLLNKTEISEKDIFFDKDLWASFSFHSSFSRPVKSDFLDKINNQIKINHERLKETDVLFITWGTAWVYQIKDSNKIAANCHKIPSSHFLRFLLETDEITKTYETFFQEIKQFNPTLKIVLTVSPIRHWKDGASGNQVSKSTLLLAANKLAEKFDFVEYFPSYEIMMDDLRDYRFYENDMLHPNSLAIKYIWGKFKSCYFSNNTEQILKKIKTIILAVNHKPFNPQTDSHQKFIHQTLSKICELKELFPELNFTEEIENLKKYLK